MRGRRSSSEEEALDPKALRRSNLGSFGHAGLTEEMERRGVVGWALVKVGRRRRQPEHK
jgi:hypothetical protein